MNQMFFRGYLFHILILLIVGFSFLELWIYLKMSTDDEKEPRIGNVRDYEAILCNVQTKENFTTKENSTTPCPVQGIVTAFNHWGLSTTMWQYANIMSVSVSNQMNPYLPECMKEALEKVFNELSVPSLSEIGHCFLPLRNSVSNYQSWKNPTQSIIFNTIDLYNEAVVEFLDIVRHQFTFKTVLIDFATSFLLSAKKNNTKVTYIGIYITQTSIILNQEYDLSFPNPQFFVDAMNYFREKYQDAFFVAITDRKGFWEGFFRKQDVIVVNEDSIRFPVGSTLAVLSKCNHSILSFDDISIWAAILSGGEAAVSVSLSEEFNVLVQNRPTWTYLFNEPKAVNKLLKNL